MRTWTEFADQSSSGTFSLCNTDQIIKTVDDANPTFWIGCDDDGLQTFYYRTMPGAANVICKRSLCSREWITD